MATLLGSEEYCLQLAEFLRDNINKKYAAEVACNSNLPNQYVVNAVRNFDDPSVPLSEFPVLKVYRNSDLYDGVTPYRSSTATITYGIAYPNLQELPDLLYWMSYALREGLTEFSYQENDVFDMKQNNRLNIEYLLTYNDVINAVHPFLRATITFKDNKIICFKKKECN